MKILIEADILDDPELCETRNDSCYKLYKNHFPLVQYKCLIFDEVIDSKNLKKCNQCKKSWKKSKETVDLINELQFKDGKPVTHQDFPKITDKEKELVRVIKPLEQ